MKQGNKTNQEKRNDGAKRGYRNEKTEQHRFDKTLPDGNTSQSSRYKVVKQRV